MTRAENPARWQSAAPFWVSLGLMPLAWIGAVLGGWTLALLPLVTWYLFALADAALGLNPRVRRWRDLHYPEITGWAPYDRRRTPMPR